MQGLRVCKKDQALRVAVSRGQCDARLLLVHTWYHILAPDTLVCPESEEKGLDSTAVARERKGGQLYRRSKKCTHGCSVIPPKERHLASGTRRDSHDVAIPVNDTTSRQCASAACRAHADHLTVQPHVLSLFGHRQCLLGALLRALPPAACPLASSLLGSFLLPPPRSVLAGLEGEVEDVRPWPIVAARNLRRRRPRRNGSLVLEVLSTRAGGGGAGGDWDCRAVGAFSFSFLAGLAGPVASREEIACSGCSHCCAGGRLRHVGLRRRRRRTGYCCAVLDIP